MTQVVRQQKRSERVEKQIIRRLRETLKVDTTLCRHADFFVHVHSSKTYGAYLDNVGDPAGVRVW